MIDPENPSTVPVQFRERIDKAAAKIGPTLCYNFEIEGNDELAFLEVQQMLTDLLALAQNDGCVAAGWAFEKLAPT